jgi:predicted ABC-type ATPase
MAILGPRPSRTALRAEWESQNRLRTRLETLFKRKVFTELRRVTRAAAKAYIDGDTFGAQMALAEHEQRLEDIFRVEYLRIFKVFGDRTQQSAKGLASPLERKDAEGIFDAATARYLTNVGGEQITHVDDTTKQNVGAAIARGIEEGENRVQISKRIRATGEGTFGRLRSAVVARTEVHSASNLAEDEMFRAMNLDSQLKRRWIAVGDDRTRPTHGGPERTASAADGQIRAFNETFTVGADQLRFPGDPAGSGREIIMCRCVIGHITPEPGQEEEPPEGPGFEGATHQKRFDEAGITKAKIFERIDSLERRGMARLERQIRGKKDTAHFFKSADGTWTPSRARNHARIVKKFLSDEAIAAATPAAGEQPTLVMFGGRGGSGKSWFTSSKNPNPVINKDRFLIVDADTVKAELTGWNPEKAGLFHQESGDVLETIIAGAREKGLNIVIDATLKTTRGAVKYMDQFVASGYRAEGFYMYLPRQEAAVRAVRRALNPASRRYVPVDIVLSNTTNEASFDAIKGRMERWRFYDNQVPRGQDPTLIAGNF